MDFNEAYTKNLLPQRPEDSHKGTFGHVLNIAGSGFYSGAAYFSSVAPLKVGAGRVTLASVETVIRTVAALSPDIILLPLDETKEKTISEKAIKTIQAKIAEYNAISIGCGLSMDKNTMSFFEQLIKTLENSITPVVIDADGLNILSKSRLQLPRNTILTPHPLELSRLLDVSVETILVQPELWVQKCCEKYNCTIILKIHKTIIADNKGRVYVNNTGNTALSKGGSGDILCGMIAGFLAQGLSTFDASILGVYLHGKTGEIASTELTEYSVLASDLLNYIHLAIQEIID